MGLTRILIESVRKQLQKHGVSCQKTKSAATYPPLPDVIQGICGPDVSLIIDVGANKGQMLAMFLRLFNNAKIICFEPMPDACIILDQIAEKNNNITIVNCALGESRGSHRFNINQNDSTSSFLDVEPAAIARYGDSIMGKKGRIEVEINTLDEYCSENNVANIDLLKIDVQGYEKYVLQGAIGLLQNKKISVIMLEVCLSHLYINQSRFSELLRIMDDNNYKMHSFYGENYDDKNGYEWGDVVFVLAD